MEMGGGSQVFELFKTYFIFSFKFVDPYWTGWKKFAYYIYIYTLNTYIHGVTVSFLIHSKTAYYNGAIYLAFYVPLTTTSVLTSLKLIICQSNKVKSILTRTIQDEAHMNNNKDEGIRNKHTSYTDKNILPIIRMYSAAILYTPFPHIFICSYFYFVGKNCDVADETCRKKLILPMYLPFDTQYYYGIATLVQCSVMPIATFVMFSTDSAFLAMAINPLLKINVLGHVLRNFDGYTSNSETNYTPEQKSFILARQCVIEHQFIIREFKDLKKNTSFIFAIDFYSRCLVNAPALFIFVKSDDMLLKSLVAGCQLCVTLQVFILYYHAQLIIDQSTGIGNALSESNWYMQDKKTQQCFLMILLRSQKYLALNAGTFIEMNLEVFLRIVKTVYSFVSVCSSMF